MLIKSNEWHWTFAQIRTKQWNCRSEILTKFRSLNPWLFRVPYLAHVMMEWIFVIVFSDGAQRSTKCKYYTLYSSLFSKVRSNASDVFWHHKLKTYSSWEFTDIKLETDALKNSIHLRRFQHDPYSLLKWGRNDIQVIEIYLKSRVQTRKGRNMEMTEEKVEHRTIPLCQLSSTLAWQHEEAMKFISLPANNLEIYRFNISGNPLICQLLESMSK